jgi:hypothetical protein
LAVAQSTRGCRDRKARERSDAGGHGDGCTDQIAFRRRIEQSAWNTGHGLVCGGGIPASERSCRSGRRCLGPYLQADQLKGSECDDDQKHDRRKYDCELGGDRAAIVAR